jgi:hypothetical protein
LAPRGANDSNITQPNRKKGFEVAEKDRLYRCLDRVLERKQELFVYLKQK